MRFVQCCEGIIRLVTVCCVLYIVNYGGITMVSAEIHMLISWSAGRTYLALFVWYQTGSLLSRVSYHFCCWRLTEKDV
jgi:hypothetical protein